MAPGRVQEYNLDDADAFICENGSVLLESKRFSRDAQLVVADVDLEKLTRDRLVTDLVRGGGRKVPLVIVLGGGYGQEAWRYSARYLSALMCRRGAMSKSR